MKRFLFTIALILILCNVVFAESNGVTYSFSKTDVRTAIQTMFKNTGYNFVIGSDVQGYIDDVSITNVPFNNAVAVVAKAGGVNCTIDTVGENQIIYTFSMPKPELVIPLESVVPDKSEPVIEPKIVIEKIPLGYADCWDIINLLNGNTNMSSTGQNTPIK